MNKLPVRQCISCRSQLARDKLLRLTRIDDFDLEHIVINPDRYHFGRSAYLCNLPSCISIAIKQKKIAKVLRVSSKAAEEVISNLRTYLVSGNNCQHGEEVLQRK